MLLQGHGARVLVRTQINRRMLKLTYRKFKRTCSGKARLATTLLNAAKKPYETDDLKWLMNPRLFDHKKVHPHK